MKNSTIQSLTLPNIFVLASAAITFAIIYIVHALFFAPYSHVPGPRICKITRLWTDIQDLLLLRPEKIYQWHKKYGPVILIAPGEVSLSGPISTREIYGSAGRHPKSTYFEHFKWYGESIIFTALGWAKHREMRKRTFGFYQQSSITKPATIDPVRARCRLFVDNVTKEITSNATIDIFHRCNLFAFDNITGLIYGPKHASHSMENKLSTERRIMDGWKSVEVWSNLLYNLPYAYRLLSTIFSYVNKDPNFLAAEEELSDWNWGKLAEVKSSHSMNADQHPSLIQHLQGMRDSSGEPLSSEQIGAEALDNIHAAQSTVAIAITYTLWNLATHTDWQEKVRDELRSLAIEDDGLPSYADIDKAPVLNACVRETYRINPVSSGRAERVVPITKEYEGVVLPSGTIVSASTLALHRSESVFPDPLSFNPARWLDADIDQRRAMEACYIPFGYGARICLGRVFANAEVKLLTAAVLLGYEIFPDEQSGTNASTMVQMGTQNALPKGLKCEVRFRELDGSHCGQQKPSPEEAPTRRDSVTAE